MFQCSIGLDCPCIWLYVMNEGLVQVQQSTLIKKKTFLNIEGKSGKKELVDLNLGRIPSCTLEGAFCVDVNLPLQQNTQVCTTVVISIVFSICMM